MVLLSTLIIAHTMVLVKDNPLAILIARILFYKYFCSALPLRSIYQPHKAIVNFHVLPPLTIDNAALSDFNMIDQFIHNRSVKLLNIQILVNERRPSLDLPPFMTASSSPVMSCFPSF